jgi:hypothetical protein
MFPSVQGEFTLARQDEIPDDFAFRGIDLICERKQLIHEGAKCGGQLSHRSSSVQYLPAQSERKDGAQNQKLQERPDRV